MVSVTFYTFLPFAAGFGCILVKRYYFICEDVFLNKIILKIIIILNNTRKVEFGMFYIYCEIV